MGSAPDEFDRGRRVGKYEILTRLSVGGMAELFLAFLPGPGGFKKFVALKQILPDVRADESFVKMFLDEARITAAFNHANIGQVFDLGEDPRSHELYLAMEFIAGQNLEQTMKRAKRRELPMPVGFACRVVHDACLGLHYAHTFTDPTGARMPVIHRDVSPKNVMVTYTGQVKVIDYGIAKAKGRLNRTQVGIVKGTSGYMSPEQVKNETLDGRSDLFAAATMLHEFITGERLFVGPTDAAMMLKIVDGPAPPLEGVGRALSDVVLKGLEKPRDARWATGRDFARAISQACPEMYDDDQVAEYMSKLFDDKIALTRSLLEVASEGRDAASISRAVQGLTTPEEPGEGSKKRLAARGSATPRPRSANSSQKLPRVPSGRSVRGLPQVGKSSRNLPRVGGSRQSLPPVGGSRQSLPPVSGQKPRRKAEDVDATLPPGRMRAESVVPPGTFRESPAAPEPAVAQPPPAPKRGLGGLVAVVVVLVAVAGLGWLFAFGPLKEHARQWLAAETEPLSAPSGPAPIVLAGSADESEKPEWLIAKQAQEAEAAAEKARQAEIEAIANDPERQKLLEDIQAQLRQLDALEEEQRQLRVDARAGKATGEANAQKIGDLQKQIDDLKALVHEKEARARPKAPAAASPTGEVQVVDDAKSARAAAVGYFTLRTINPSSAAIFLDATALGSTPLVKVPLDVGVHKLRVVDGDSKSRLLSISIEPGKTAEMKGIDVGTLPAWP